MRAPPSTDSAGAVSTARRGTRSRARRPPECGVRERWRAVPRRQAGSNRGARPPLGGTGGAGPFSHRGGAEPVLEGRRPGVWEAHGARRGEAGPIPPEELETWSDEKIEARLKELEAESESESEAGG